MPLLVDRGLDHLSVEGVWDEGDDKGDLANLALEGCAVGDIEGDGVAVLETLAKLLCGFEGTAGF